MNTLSLKVPSGVDCNLTLGYEVEAAATAFECAVTYDDSTFSHPELSSSINITASPEIKMADQPLSQKGRGGGKGRRGGGGGEPGEELEVWLSRRLKNLT